MAKALAVVVHGDPEEEEGGADGGHLSERVLVALAGDPVISSPRQGVAEDGLEREDGDDDFTSDGLVHVDGVGHGNVGRPTYGKREEEEAEGGDHPVQAVLDTDAVQDQSEGAGNDTGGHGGETHLGLEHTTLCELAKQLSNK